MSLSTTEVNKLTHTLKRFAESELKIKKNSILLVEVMPESVEFGWEFHPDFHEVCVDVILEYKDNNNDLFAVSAIITDNYEVVKTDSFGITYEYC